MPALSKEMSATLLDTISRVKNQATVADNWR